MKTMGAAGDPVNSRFGRRRPALWLYAVVLSWAGLVARAIGQEVTTFNVPGGKSYDITQGPDGNLWFTEVAFEASGHNIGRCTPSGTVTEFPIPNAGSAGSITSGPDGNVWFTEYDANRVGRITPTGVITEFSIPTPQSFPQGIVTGPDGNLWVMEENGNKIAKMTPQGLVVDEFPIPSVPAEAQNITVGSDGNLWFTEQITNKIGRMTTAGVFTEFAIPTADSLPHGITSGPDGNLWFVEGQAFNIGRITTAGVITEFPSQSTYPTDIAAGSDGNLWFVGDNGDIGRITTAGVVTSFSGPGSSGIAAGPDGNLWLTPINDRQIGRITTGPCTASATTLCLSNSRFRVVATWRDPLQGDNGQATAAPVSGSSGYFWFFDPASMEVAVKLLDGCSVNDRHWFFAGGLTNREVSITVTDLQGGQVQTYTRPAGPPFEAIQDTASFSSCP